MPVDDPVEEDRSEDAADTVVVNAIIADSARNVCPDLQVEKLRTAAMRDKEYQNLIQALRARSANSDSVPAGWNRRVFEELSLCDGLVMRGSQMIVPREARKEVLLNLHASHQGIERTKRRARQVVYWPSIGSDIKNMIDACLPCQELRQRPAKEPLIQDVVPTRPFEMATSDLFQIGRSHFVVYADRLSGYPLVAEMNKLSSLALVKVCRIFFGWTGVPNRLRSDQGPQYEGHDFQKFLKEWGVEWMPSSPHNPQSNGAAEAMVKSVKYLLKKCGGNINSEQFLAGIIELRNTPREDGLSPAERLFGHPLRSLVPAHWKSFDPQWQTKSDEADYRRLRSAAKAKEYYDRSAQVRHPLSVGDTVLVHDYKSQRWNLIAEVIERDNRTRRYRVKFPSGRTWWRNAKFLRRLNATLPSEEAAMCAAEEEDIEDEKDTVPERETVRRSTRLLNR